MKNRNGFVSNSSSSSFILAFDKQLTNNDKFDWLIEILGNNIQYYTNVSKESEQIKNFYEDFNYIGSCEKIYNEKIDSYLKQIKNNAFDLGFPFEYYDLISRKNWASFKNVVCKLYKEWNDEREYNKFFRLSWRRFKKSEIKRIKENIEYYTNLMLKFKNKELYSIEFVGSGDGPDVYFNRNDWEKGKTKSYDDLYCLFYQNKLYNLEKYIVERDF